MKYYVCILCFFEYILAMFLNTAMGCWFHMVTLWYNVSQAMSMKSSLCALGMVSLAINGGAMASSEGIWLLFPRRVRFPLLSGGIKL